MIRSAILFVAAIILACVVHVPWARAQGEDVRDRLPRTGACADFVNNEWESMSRSDEQRPSFLEMFSSVLAEGNRSEYCHDKISDPADIVDYWERHLDYPVGSVHLNVMETWWYFGRQCLVQMCAQGNRAATGASPPGTSNIPPPVSVPRPTTNPPGTVECGNGRHCAPGNICINGGMSCLSRSSNRVCSNGTSYCKAGTHCTSQNQCAWDLPAGAVRCGGGYCNAGYMCTKDAQCAPAGAVRCGGGYCNAGNICTQDDHCLSLTSNRVCANGSTYCNEGFHCTVDKHCMPDYSPKTTNLDQDHCARVVSVTDDFDDNVRFFGHPSQLLTIKVLLSIQCTVPVRLYICWAADTNVADLRPLTVGPTWTTANPVQFIANILNGRKPNYKVTSLVCPIGHPYCLLPCDPL